MADNTTTFVLNGEVSLDAFAKAISHFNDLMAELSAEAHASIEWVIQDLQVSSAMATSLGRGISEQVSQVVAAYEDVSTALESGAEILHTEPVRRAATNLVFIEDLRIPSVLMQTATRDAVISPRREPSVYHGHPFLVPKVEVKRAPAFGAIRGRIQTLTNRGGLRFTLYDLMHDKAVSCYFAEGKQELIRGMWGKLASVQGIITRDPLSGRPISVRGVTEITPLPELEPSHIFDYQQARGCAPSLSGLSPEDAIRKARDAN